MIRRESVASTAPRPGETNAASVALGIIAALGIAGFAVLTWLVATSASIPFDAPLRDLALQWKAYASLWSLLSDAANLPLIAIGVGIVLWLLLKRQFREAIVVAVLLGVVTAGSEAVKQLVHRPRPPASDAHVIGVVYSFPSGHVLEAMTILGIVAILVWRSQLPSIVRVAVAVAVAVFVVAVAVARVAIDAHYPSDVLAGFFGAAAALAIYVLLTRNRRAHQARLDR